MTLAAVQCNHFEISEKCSSVSPETTEKLRVFFLGISSWGVPIRPHRRSASRLPCFDSFQKKLTAAHSVPKAPARRADRLSAKPKLRDSVGCANAVPRPITCLALPLPLPLASSGSLFCAHHEFSESLQSRRQCRLSSSRPTSLSILNLKPSSTVLCCV